MKRYIKSSNQAEYERSLRDSDTKSAMDIMFDSEDYQDDPELGIFWYDPKTDELFGVTKVFSTDTDWYHSNQWNTDVKTDRHLQKNVWQRNYHRGRDNRFYGDHTMIPRGRVFEFKDSGFKVFTGDWIIDYPQVKDLILEEFNLPADRTEFVTDIHWDIGHGWSDEF